MPTQSAEIVKINLKFKVKDFFHVLLTDPFDYKSFVIKEREFYNQLANKYGDRFVELKLERILDSSLQQLDPTQLKKILTVLATIPLQYEVYEKVRFFIQKLAKELKEIKELSQLEKLYFICTEYKKRMLLIIENELDRENATYAPINFVTQYDGATCSIRERNISLKIACQKFSAMNEMEKKLEGNDPIELRLKKFYAEFIRKKSILQLRRDSTAITIGKIFLTISHVSLATLLGVWNVKSQETIDEIESLFLNLGVMRIKN